jgi:hypothetical protein
MNTHSSQEASGDEESLSHVPLSSTPTPVVDWPGAVDIEVIDISDEVVSDDSDPVEREVLHQNMSGDFQLTVRHDTIVACYELRRQVDGQWYTAATFDASEYQFIKSYFASMLEA